MPGKGLNGINPFIEGAFKTNDGGFINLRVLTPALLIEDSFTRLGLLECVQDERFSIFNALQENTLIGKRYVHEVSGLEVLGAKPGVGSLAFDGIALVLKDAQPLPALD